MKNFFSRLIFLVLVVTPLLGEQRASVSASANSGSPYDARPFGKYLVETCTLSGERLTLTCKKIVYPVKVIEHPAPCPQAKGKPCTFDVAVQKKDQNITIKVVCDPAKKDPCDSTDPRVGDEFFVSATSDSGLQVTQTVLLGNATPPGGRGIVHYHANAIGPIVIRATVQAKTCSQGAATQACNYAEASPVDLILQVSGASAAKPDLCPVLPPSAGAQSKPLDAATIVSLLGNPTPFILSAQGANTIFIYTTRLPVNPNETQTLGSFQQAMAELAGRTIASLGITPTAAKPFTVELKIPHASALGDLATRIGGLNYSQFTVQDVGRGWVRITASTQPNCETWKGFLKDIREMAWQVVSASMSTKLYYLSSSDVATAFSGLTASAVSPSASSSSPSSASAPSSSSTSSPTSSGPSTAATAGPPQATLASVGSIPSSASSSPAGASTGAPSSPSAPSSSSSSATIAITQPPGSNIQISSDTTPCVIAGLAFGNSAACGSAAAPAGTAAAGSPSATTAGPAVTPVAPGPLSMASVSVAAGTGEQNPPDLLVYSDTNPGDDAQIVERNRVLAQLDLPRPEMILSAWVTQNSTTSQEAIGAFGNLVKGMVADYNEQYERVLWRGWNSLKRQQQENRDYFNEPFRSYLADRFVADTYAERKVGGSLQELSQAFLNQSQAKMADPVFPAKRTDLGICERGRYCLGYTNLFRHGINSNLQSNSLDPFALGPIRPTLTDLLLGIIAAQQPLTAAVNLIKDVEGSTEPVPPCGDCICDDQKRYDVEIKCTHPGGVCKNEDAYRKELIQAESRARCRAIWRNLDLNHVTPPPQSPSCEERDFRGILGSLFADPAHEPRVHLQCFEDQAIKLLVLSDVDPHTPSTCKTSGENCERALERLKRLEREADQGLRTLGNCKPKDKGCQEAEEQFKHMQNEAAGDTAPHEGVEELGLLGTNSTLVQEAKVSGRNPPFGTGLFRAAIADFLFDYKMSQQYPHEFVAYDLTQSANNLNNALSPLIDAFSRDLWSYQMFVRADMQYQVEKLNARWDQRCCVKRLFGLDKPSFFNDGLVTVRTISGQPTSVSVTSQSFLNGSTAPELSSLLSSLATLGGSGGGGGGSTTTTAGTTTTTTTTTTSGGSSSSPASAGPPVNGLFGIYGALPAILANYQTSYAQIGRQLSFTATPRTLATASSAEIAVSLNADESAGGPLYTGPGANDPAFNTSRVANHDTSTRVRVDSIKLFEVSSFSAIVERSRSRFPLLPPFVEIPYIGTFVGIPLGSAKEFHSSTAIISAYVIPTAADIAYGLRFVSDLVVDAPQSGPCAFYKGAAGPDINNVCVFRYPSYAWHDLPTQPIREFNRNITRCFATDTSPEGCMRQVSFDSSLETQ
jgi:hypothetical protein